MIRSLTIETDKYSSGLVEQIIAALKGDLGITVWNRRE
jgi:hypothetical protein